MKIGVMGTPVSTGNRGVLALGSSLIRLCSDASGGGDVVLLISNRDNKPVSFRVEGGKRMVPVVNCRMSPQSPLKDHIVCILLLSLAYRLLPLRLIRGTIKRFNPWIKTIIECDLVGDVRGGDSFSDIYGLRRFAVGFIYAWTVLLVKGRMVFFPQTFGPYNSFLARFLARYLLKRSLVIIARDKFSQKVAQEMVGPEKEVGLSPDVAFSLESIRPERIELNPALSGPVPSSIIGLNVNGLMYHGGYTRDNMFRLKLDYASLLPILIASLLQEYPGELWLIPHTFEPEGNVESDPDASRKVFNSLPPDYSSRIRIVNKAYDQYEIKGVIGLCDFFIGSRMHSCIAALSQGIPCVGIAYSRKFEGVFDSVEMNEWVIDARTSTNQEAIQRVLGLFRQRDSIRNQLKKNASIACSQLQKIFQELVREAATSKSRFSA